MDVIEARPIVTRFEISENHIPYEHMETCLLFTAYQAWYHEKCLTFQGKVQDNRLALGFEFSGNMQSIANILIGIVSFLIPSIEPRYETLFFRRRV